MFPLACLSSESDEICRCGSLGRNVHYVSPYQSHNDVTHIFVLGRGKNPLIFLVALALDNMTFVVESVSNNGIFAAKSVSDSVTFLVESVSDGVIFLAELV